MIQAYVYSIKVLDTKQFYLGSRGGNIKLNREPEDDLWVKYKTSSKSMLKLIKQLGDEAFETKIIAKFDSHENAYWFEQDFIKQHHKNPLCLNKHFVERAINKRVFCGMAGVPKSEEHKRKIALSNMGKHNNPEHHRKSGLAQRGKTLSLEHKAKLAIASTGRNHTQEAIAKMRGRKDPIGAAKRIGRKHTPETLAKMRESKRIRDIAQASPSS